jgi:hypothetical protein
MEFHPEGDGNIDILLGKKDFMEKAKYKLAQAMDNEIEENIRVIKLMSK